MRKPSPLKAAGKFLSLIILVIILSMISNSIWGGKPESIPAVSEIIIDQDMNLKEFGQANNFTNPLLKNIFDLRSRSDLQKKLADYGTVEEITSLVKKKIALTAEHETKNWLKIFIKFFLWFAFLLTIFFYFKNRKANEPARKTLLFISVLIFGIVMGSDPSPMGTVKDAIHLFGSSGAVFPPRMIALFVFLAIVFLANKYICAWGCQIGVLQDLIFRINQTDKRKAIAGKQFKIPFVISNSIRIIFLAVFTVIAFVWGLDIVEPIDPFKIYKPLYLGIAGALFTGILLIVSLFVYRPWCHFLCPFGLVGWLVEKLSRIKINVNYDTCIACRKCAEACPSTVMNAILTRTKKTIPDCFACYTCRDVCPTESISFSAGKRNMPPAGHFDKE